MNYLYLMNYLYFMNCLYFMIYFNPYILIIGRVKRYYCSSGYTIMIVLFRKIIPNMKITIKLNM